MSDSPQLGFCVPCLAKGHRCETNSQVDGKFICAFCEDGEECPQMKLAQRRAVVTAARVPKTKTATLPPGNVAPIPHNAATEKQRTAPKGSIAMETKKCRHPECSTMITPTNKSGACTSHWYWSTKNPIGGAVASPKTRAVVKRETRNVKRSSSPTPPPSTFPATPTSLCRKSIWTSGSTNCRSIRKQRNSPRGLSAGSSSRFHVGARGFASFIDACKFAGWAQRERTRNE